MAAKKVSIRLAVEAENVDAVRKQLEQLGAEVKRVDGVTVDNARRQFEALERRLDPVTRAARQLAKDTAALDAALKDGATTQERYNQLLTAAHAAHDRAVDAAKRMAGAADGAARSTRLAVHEVTNLSFQIQDAAVQLAGGQNPLLILAQQGPQATMAVGGLNRAIALLATPMAAAIAGAAALAGGIGLIVARSAQMQSELRAWTVLLRATGQEAATTAEQLRGVVDATVKAGATRGDAAAVVEQMVRSRKLGGEELLRELAALSVDMGEAFGGTVAAGEKLTQWLTTGVPGLRKMADETEALTLAQYEAARSALEHGNRAQALRIAVDALKERFAGLHREALSPARQALEDLHHAYTDLLTTAAEHPITLRVVTEFAGPLTGLMKGLAGTSGVPTRDEASPATIGLFIGRLLQGQLKGAMDAANPPRLPTGPNVVTVPVERAPEPPLAPGAPVPGKKPISNSEARDLSDLAAANDRLLAAMRQVGAARQVAAAGVQAEIAALKAGKSAAAARLEGMEAERMARAELSASISEQSALLTLEARGNLDVADAYLKSAAAGAVAEARRQATAESLRTGIDVEARTREILAESAAQLAATSAQAVQQMELEVVAREDVAAASLLGVEAQHKAELAEKIRQATLAETIALENAQGETADALRGIIERKTAAVLADDAAQRKAAAGAILQQQKDQLSLGQAQLRLIAATAEERAVEMARLQALMELKRQHIDLDGEEARHILRNAEALARLGLEQERAAAGLREMEGFGEKAFDRLATWATETGQKTLKLGDAVRAVGLELYQLGLRMAVLNPLKNAVFGTNLPTAGDLPILGGGAGGRSGAQGGGVGIGDALGLGNLFSGGGSGLMQSVVSGASELIFNVTGSAGLAQGIGLGIQASPWGILGGLGANLLGLGGKGGIGGMIGGTVGSVAGGAVGASALGSLLGAAGGPVGAIIGSFLGTALGGLFGPNPSVGPNAQGNVIVKDGRFVEGPSAADNGGDAGPVRQATAQVAARFNAMIDAYGLRSTGRNFGLFTGGDRVTGNGVKTVEELVKAMVAGGVTADGLVGRALGSEKVKSLTSVEDVAGYLDLAKRIEDGATALAEFDGSIAGVQRAARKAQAEALKPMADELARAAEIGLEADHKALVGNQLAAMLDNIRNPREWTRTETAVATLKGQLAAVKEAAERVSPALAATIDAVQVAAMQRIANDLNKGLDQQINEAAGRGYVNQLQDFVDALAINTRDLAAVGEPATRAQALFNAQIEGLLRTLTDAQLADVATTFGGDIAALAKTLRGSAEASRAATEAAETMRNAQVAAARAVVTAIQDQIRAAEQMQQQWSGLVRSLNLYRTGLLTDRDLSILDPQARLAEAQNQYRQVLARAKLGDATAIGNLQRVADVYLRAGRDFHATTQGYVAIFNEVQTGLGNVEDVAARQARIADDQLTVLRAQLDVQQRTLDALEGPQGGVAGAMKTVVESYFAARKSKETQLGRALNADEELQVMAPYLEMRESLLRTAGNADFPALLEYAKTVNPGFYGRVLQEAVARGVAGAGTSAPQPEDRGVAQSWLTWWAGWWREVEHADDLKAVLGQGWADQEYARLWQSKVDALQNRMPGDPAVWQAVYQWAQGKPGGTWENVRDFAQQRHIPGFVTGGSFTVGGPPGIDNVMVALRATPGEVVDIRRPYQAPTAPTGVANDAGLGRQIDRLVSAVERLIGAVEEGGRQNAGATHQVVGELRAVGAQLRRAAPPVGERRRMAG